MSDKPSVTCNDTQRLFTIKTSGGYSCFGYDNCYRDAVAMAQKFDRPDLMPVESEKGTLTQYAQYTALVGVAVQKAQAGVDIGTWFTPGTPGQVEAILERARKTGQRLKITYGNAENGQPWDDHAMTGRISRSMGPLKVPILLSNRRSLGGEALLTDCIIRIAASPGGRLLYEHPGLKPDVAPETEPALGM